MKKARMNISHSHFILFKLKIFGEIVTTLKIWTKNRPVGTCQITSVCLKSILRPNQGCFFVKKFSFVKALNFIHQLPKSHLCKNAKEKGLARSKNMH